jgi:hypothetical protein
VLGQPGVRRGEISGRRGEHKRRPSILEELLEVLTSGPVRAPSEVDAGHREDVEHDEGGRGELASACGVHRGRVDAPLQRGEVEPAVAVDAELAIDDRPGRELLDDRGGDLGEVAGERPQLPALQERALGSAEGETAIS